MCFDGEDKTADKAGGQRNENTKSPEGGWKEGVEGFLLQRKKIKLDVHTVWSALRAKGERANVRKKRGQKRFR